MADLSLFRFSVPVDVRYADIDALQHVNNARYFTYMETARVHYEANAVGPMRQRYRSMLELKADAMRAVVVAESAPMMRIAWAFGSLIIIVALQAVRTVLSWIKCRASIIIQVLAGVTQLGALCVGTVAALECVGEPPVRLEPIAAYVQLAAVWSADNAIILGVSVFSVLAIASLV